MSSINYASFTAYLQVRAQCHTFPGRHNSSLWLAGSHTFCFVFLPVSVCVCAEIDTITMELSNVNICCLFKLIFGGETCTVSAVLSFYPLLSGRMETCNFDENAISLPADKLIIHQTQGLSLQAAIFMPHFHLSLFI